jgi:hypothetical protein
MASSNPSAGAGAKARRPLQWATSQSIGGVTEIAVLSPIRKGIVPGERRTYEERLRATIANLAMRHRQGIPNELDRVSTIHFGRMIIIRPEQYLFYAKDIENIDFYPKEAGAAAARGVALATGGSVDSDMPMPLDDFSEIHAPTAAAALPGGQPRPSLRSWVLTLVEFDGELKSYMREIAHFIGLEFDRIFDNCEGYPGTADFEKFWIWIRTFQINTDLFYASYRDLSVVRIRQLEAFKRRFDAFVATVRSPTGPTVRSMDEMFDEFLRENQQYAAGFPMPGGTYSLDDER